MVQSVYTQGALPRKHPVSPVGLSIGGRVIWSRTGLSVAVCNLLASLAGIGSEG